MQGYWNHIPLLRYLIPLVSGIIAAINFKLNSEVYYWLFAGLCLIYLVLFSFKRTSASFALQPFLGLLLNVLLFFSGITLVITGTPVYQKDYFMHAATAQSIFQCRISKPVEETVKNYKLYVEVDKRIDSSGDYRSVGKALIYIKKGSAGEMNFNYGDKLIIKNNFKEPEPPRNPEEFNYKRYLQHAGIYHTAFLKAEEVIATGDNNAKWQWELLFACRKYFIRLMEKYVKDENSLDVGTALILGNKSTIDEEVQQAYANTGTMHILAVSGLHVGILFVILEFLFKPLHFFTKKRKRAALVKTIIILCIIWIYACLTGMSPSVMRSAVMFSFLAFGKLYDRHIDSFNILFVSAIPLLIFNPYQIMQVGFQLSYLAVGGIIFFQPLIASVWKPSNKLLKYIWSMITVSIAAQLATSPISIYYFHQFPNYFLLSNMIAIPVSFVVLILGVAFFILGAIPLINEATGFLLDWSLRILNGSVITVDKLPHAVTGNLYNNLLETLLIYFAIFMLGAFIILKQKNYMLLMLTTILAACVSISLRQLLNQQRREITFYNLKDHTAIAISRGTDCVLLTDNDSLPASDDYQFHIKNHLIQQGIHNPAVLNTAARTPPEDTMICYYKFPFLFAGGETFYFLNQSNQKNIVSNAGEIDNVVLTGSPFLKIDSTFQFRNSRIIIDNTNSWKSCNYWTKRFDEEGISYYNIKEQSLTIEY